MTSRGPDAPVLPVREAYRLWAPSYHEENPVTALDRAAVRMLGGELRGARLLDAGCGTGRRLADAREEGAERVVGIDLVETMLRNGDEGRHPAGVAVADLRALPFPPAAFGVVWCRLVVGHLRDLTPAYREFARVLTAGGRLLITDFHPEAARAGHLRTLRDAAGKLWKVEHHVHDVGEHVSAASAAGLRASARLDLPIGPELRPFYRAADALERYERDRGLPLVLAALFTR